MPIALGRARLALWLARSALALTALSGALALAAVIGYRAGWFDVSRALHGILPAAVVIAFLSLLLVAIRIIAVLRSDTAPGVVPAFAAMIGAFVILGGPITHYRGVQAQSPLYDVTTDFSNPPVSTLMTFNAFDEILAETQKATFPDIFPVMLPDPPPVTFERAVAVAKRIGWKIIAADPAAGVIEARNSTLWFGFIDDVVIRVRPQGTGSRVDVRAVSRQPAPDVGVNVRRFRKFLALLTKV